MHPYVTSSLWLSDGTILGLLVHCSRDSYGEKLVRMSKILVEWH